MALKRSNTNPETEEERDWEYTAVQYLLRYRPSGKYYARFRLAGRTIWKSLKTTSFSVAKQRLPDVVREHRTKEEAVKAFANGKMTVGEAIVVYTQKIDADVSLKPRSKDYRKLMIDFITRSWPSLVEMDIRKITERDCSDWLMKYQNRYSPSVVNNSIGTLRGIFKSAIDMGARFNDPAANLRKVKIIPKRLQLPSREQFLNFVKEIGTSGAGQSKDCANLVCLLAYSGMRIGETRFLTWADVNFKTNMLHVKGDPITATKNGETRMVPMIDELAALLAQMRAARSDESSEAIVMRVFECQKSMDTAAKKVGMKRITHHDLRHLYATICIESGVDIPTVSRWLGHKDGGALCMKTYGHLRQEHSSAQAKKVSFGMKV